MLTFKGAFFDGLVSPTLVSRWCHEDEGMVLSRTNLLRQDNFNQTVWAMAVTSMIAVFLEDKFFGHTDDLAIVVGLTAGLSLLLFLILLAQSAWGPMSKFLADCKELSKYISKPGLLDESSLRSAAEIKLIDLATEIFAREGLFGEQDTLRKTSFKSAFEIMKRFGLTESDWNPYFKKARIAFDEYCVGRASQIKTG